MDLEENTLQNQPDLDEDDEAYPSSAEASGVQQINTHCVSCGIAMKEDYGDGLCQTCFVAQGMETVVELLSSQEQQSLFESLIFLSHQAHQREQTDAAFHSLSAAYHAAYEPSQLEAIIREAQERADSWEPVLDECGEVRAADYIQIVQEAEELKRDMLAMLGSS